jgi:hypothetical protein
MGDFASGRNAVEVLYECDTMFKEQTSSVSLLKCPPINRRDSFLCPIIPCLKMIPNVTAQGWDPERVGVSSIDRSVWELQLAQVVSETWDTCGGLWM